MRIFSLLISLIIFSGCGKNATEKTNEAIDIALTLLSSSKCHEAIKVLEDAGSSGRNGVYLQVLASAYACKASFNEIAFIANDLTSINAGSVEDIFKSISIMSLSDETETDSDNYVAIRTGINIILNNSNQSGRNSKFGTRRAGDMGVQALILNIVNLGKFLNYYGNVNGNGDKGQGSGNNNCFINYTQPSSQAYITHSSNYGGVCNAVSDGHSDLDQSTVAGKRRMCEGLMLFTNIIDILNNLDLSGSSDLSVLEDIATQVNTYKDEAEQRGLGDLINMTSQSACETYLNNSSNMENVELLYALLFETGLQ